MENLNSLNSRLQSLELGFYFCTVRFNSTTFQSLPKWKDSLQELKIYFSSSDIQIEGSPFKWFSELHLLSMCDLILLIPFGSAISWHSPENTFVGLSNLKEVYLNHLNINDKTAYNLLSTFVMYNYIP